MVRIVSYDGSAEMATEICNWFRDHGGIPNDLKFGRDAICVALNEADRVCGVLATRAMVLAHEFRTADSMNKLEIASALWNYAKGAGVAAGHDECLMLIDKANTSMLRFSQAQGAVVESQGEDFVVSLKVR